jgi:hypothetical protein
MKAVIVMLTLALLALAAPPAAGEATTVTATLQVGAGNHLAPALFADCEVTVAAGSAVGDLLDAAAAQGCIGSWEAQEFAGFGRYVTCIDDVCEQVVGGLFGTWWAFYVDEAFATQGIDDTPVRDGTVYEFVYSDWYVSGFLP